MEVRVLLESLEVVSYVRLDQLSVVESFIGGAVHIGACRFQRASMWVCRSVVEWA